MAKHEFGIIDKLDKEKDYSNYEPKEYNCIEVDDELVTEMLKYLKKLRTYHHNYSNPSFGIAYTGVTLIPDTSLMFLHDIASTLNRFKRSQELTDLTCLIMEAKIKGKYIIHYGI